MASHGIPRVSGTALDKSDAAKEKERNQIESYKTLEKDVVERIKAKDYSNTTFQLTSRLLTQNPEYYTIWNYRRLLLHDVFDNELSQHNTIVPEEEGTQDADQAAAAKAGQTPAQREITLLIEEDLRFLIPLLKQFPKCYWIWNHRSWLLGQATKHLPSHTAIQLWKGELGLVSKMLALDSRNFHGWGYRREVVDSIEKLSGKSMVEDEFGYTTKMINTNLSNFSAWHYRSQLIPRLLELREASSEDRKAFFELELELITNALWTDPYDQSLWFYHQYLLATLDPDNARASSILEPCTNADRVKYLEHEIDSIREMMDGAEDCKYMYQALLEYSRRYLDLEAGSGFVSTKEMSGWLKELKTRDPLRAGRWSDLEGSMEL